MIAAMDAVWLCYNAANTAPATEASFGLAVTAVQGWCDEREDLERGSGWVEDRVVAGYELFVVSDVYDSTAGKEYHYNKLRYSTQGQGIAESYLMALCTQERSEYDETVTPKVDWVELFDVYIRKSWATPVLAVAEPGEVTLAGGESASLEATLRYSYINREGEAEETDGKSGEEVGFSITKGPGELSAASASTDDDGKAEVSFTPQWATSELDNEQAVVTVRLTHGELELSDTLVVHEGANPLIESTSPFDAQTEVETGSAITVRFREAMETETVDISVSPATAGTKSWSEGQVLWTLAPGAALADKTTYTVTVKAGATAASGATLARDYVFKFRTGVTVPAGFVEVAGGTFQMGSTTGHADEQPVHTVTVSSFLISKYEVTQAQYLAVIGSNPSYFTGDSLPVEQVSWYDAVAYCNELSADGGLEACYVIAGDSTTCDSAKNGYRLPTEAEWEFAARGGKKSEGYEYAGSDTVGDVAWYADNSGEVTHPVGTKDPNELGIYDMSGNVSEWCWDWYGSYGSDAQTNPTGPGAGTRRLIRGGGCESAAHGVCPALRAHNTSDHTNSGLGFRVVRRP